MADAYVVGVDMIKFGRFPEKSVPQLGSEAALMALDDCGLTIQDMQALYCGNLGQASGMVGQRILQQIGQTGIPVVNCRQRVRHGRDGVSGSLGVVSRRNSTTSCIAVGVEQMGRGLLGGGGGGRSGILQGRICSARARCRRFSPRPAWSTHASMEPPSNSSPRSP